MKDNMECIRLETERLILREIEESDWEAAHRYARDPEVTRFMTWGPNTEEETRAFIQRVLMHRSESPRQEIDLGLISKQDGDFLGAISIFRRGLPEQKQAEIGYCMRRDCWGKGYMTEAAKALVEFGFGEWGLHRIIGRVDAENTASRRVLEKAGLRVEGLLRKDNYLRGEWRDMLVLGMLEGDR